MVMHFGRAALIVLVIAAAPAPAAAQADKIAGRWVGNGLVCITSAGAQEATRGAFDITLVADSTPGTVIASGLITLCDGSRRTVRNTRLTVNGGEISIGAGGRDGTISIAGDAGTIALNYPGRTLRGSIARAR
jgi:hypothetical protein